MDLFDQDVMAAHSLCWDDVDGEWWFDNGELCTHPDWHNDKEW